MFTKIFDALPPPKFLDVPVAGISISDTSLHCIQFGRKGGNLYIEKYAEREITPGVVVSGQINNKSQVVKMLEDLKNELKLSHVKVSLPEEKAYLFTDKIPTVKPSEIRGVIESTIEDNVPLPGQELIFDYKVISHHQEKGHIDISVSAMPRSLIDTYLDIINTAGLKVVSLEIESQAIAKAVLKEGIKGTVLLTNFGKEKVGLYVAHNRIIHFASTVLLKDPLARDLSNISKEIKKLFEYWYVLTENIDKPEKKISQIIVCGENLPDKIVSYLSIHNTTKTSLANVWSNVFDLNDTVPTISLSDSLRYATAIGLILPLNILI